MMQADAVGDLCQVRFWVFTARAVGLLHPGSDFLVKYVNILSGGLDPRVVQGVLHEL